MSKRLTNDDIDKFFEYGLDIPSYIKHKKHLDNLIKLKESVSFSFSKSSKIHTSSPPQHENIA